MEDKFLKVAKQAAIEAGKLISERFGGEQEKYDKGDSSNFATQADLDANELIIKTISKSFPDHNIISEEKEEIRNNSVYTWVIDPLDGTLSFVANMPFFAVSIGLLYNSQPFLGVLYWITENKLYFAQKGKGAYLNNRKIKVSNSTKLQNSVLGVDFGHQTSRERKFERYIKPFIHKTRYTYSLASDAVVLALIAEGALDGFACDANVWDFAGGLIIVEEAGGKVTDPEGKAVDWTKKRMDVVASNGLIHNQILEALNQNR